MMQSQFSALQREKDSLRKAIEAAERDRQKIQDKVRMLKHDESTSYHETQSIKADLGEYTRQTSMIREKESRLKATLDKERKELEGCARALEDLKNEENDLKKEYSRQLEELAASMMDTIDRESACRVQEFISLDSIAALEGDVRMTEVVDDAAFLENVELMKEAMVKYTAKMEELGDSELRLQEIRSQARGTVDADDWDVKEKVWAQEDLGRASSQGDTEMTSTEQLDFFYGTDERVGETNE